MTKAADDDNYDYPTLECKRFLYNMGDNPSNYQMHVEEYTSRTISRLAWGSAGHARELRRGTFGLLQTISPSGAVPNVVAPLAHLPSWLSPWQKIENARHEREATFFRYALNTVKDAISSTGTAVPSLMRMFLEGREKAGIEEDEGQYIVGMMAIAGALTIGSPIQSYILAMCHYPEWQAKMREEMSAVCGERCPKWEDREKMPLLRAVVKEVVRWRPPVPTGK
jgi:cytochrome P450